MEDKKIMQYGMKYRVGNYMVLKYNKALRKSEVAELRSQMFIPPYVQKHLQRATLPVIKVFAMSGIWSIEFGCNTAVYKMLDEHIAIGGNRIETMFAHLFNMWFMDTTIPGDEEYKTDKAAAFKAFMERRKSDEISEEEDDKVLEEMKKGEENKAKIVEMSEAVAKTQQECMESGDVNKEGGGDEG